MDYKNSGHNKRYANKLCLQWSSLGGRINSATMDGVVNPLMMTPINSRAEEEKGGSLGVIERPSAAVLWLQSKRASSSMSSSLVTLLADAMPGIKSSTGSAANNVVLCCLCRQYLETHKHV